MRRSGFGVTPFRTRCTARRAQSATIMALTIALAVVCEGAALGEVPGPSPTGPTASIGAAAAAFPKWVTNLPVSDDMILGVGSAVAENESTAVRQAESSARESLIQAVATYIEPWAGVLAAPVVDACPYLEDWTNRVMRSETARSARLAVRWAEVAEREVRRDDDRWQAYVLMKIPISRVSTLCNEITFRQFSPGSPDVGSVVRGVPRLPEASRDGVYVLPDDGGTPASSELDDLPGFIPHITWPPPSESARVTIPLDGLLEGFESPVFEDVADRLRVAFEDCGYGELGWYMAPDGFAVVTRLEQMEPDGQSVEGRGRWCVDSSAPQRFSLGRYFKALFTATPGLYRAILVVVSPHSFSKSSMRASVDEAAAWQRAGMTGLPRPIAAMAFTDDHRCVALVYEFERATPDHDPVLKEQSELLGREHLEQGCVWGSLGR